MIIGNRKFAAVTLAVGLALLYGATCLRVAMNGSQSLPHTGYLMAVWPKVPWNGAYAAFEVPRAYRDQFEGLVFIKQIRGLAGDTITYANNAVCVNGACFELAMKNGRPFAPATATGRIGAGQMAAFASAPDSLDSRYATVGLFKREDLIAVGFPIPIPHWKVLKAWLDG